MAKYSQKSKKGQNENSKKALPIIAICLTVIVLGIGIFIGCVYFANFNTNGTILNNVSVAGVDVGGMTQAQAVAAVQAATDNTYSQKSMVVKILDEQTELSPSLCSGLNVRGAVREAYRYGQSGSESKRKNEQDVAATSGYAVNLAPYLKLNESAIRDALAQLGAKYSTTLSQSKYEVTGTAPDQTLVVHLGVPEYGLDLNKLYDQVVAAYSQNVFTVEGECSMIEPDPIALEDILAKYYIAPVDASFDPDTFDIIEGKDGYGFDIAAAKEKLQNAAFGTTVEIPFSNIKPQTTSETLSEMLYRDKLSTYTATSSSIENRDTNLRLACEAINGTVLFPGDVFSYNTVLGERTTAKGYKTGTSYNGGEIVETVGGGICQVSSSLYYCVMVADLEILTRSNHGYATSYMPLGMDATVSWGSVDFRFRNTLDYPIRIEASASGGSTTVTLMGTDTKDYYVKMEYEVLSTQDYDTVYQEMDANNPKGYKDGEVIEKPYTGYTVETYRCKYNKENDELIEKKFEEKSKYQKKDAVICKIVNETTPIDTNPPGPEPGIGNGGVTDEGALPPELP